VCEPPVPDSDVDLGLFVLSGPLSTGGLFNWDSFRYSGLVLSFLSFPFQRIGGAPTVCHRWLPKTSAQANCTAPPHPSMRT
jgi:hypothetical protein